MVARASGAHPDAHRERALDDICRTYWFPLYAFARGRGASPDDAADLTQGFFSSVLQTDFFAKAEPGRGKMRTFLLAAFTRFLSNAHRDSTRLKRGGGHDTVSIEMSGGEERLAAVQVGKSIESLYDKHWALTLIDTAMSALRATYASRGKEGHFAALEPLLHGEADEATYAQAANDLRLSINAARMEVFRMRKKFRVELRRTIADTLNEPSAEDIEEELNALKRALSE